MDELYNENIRTWRGAVLDILHISILPEVIFIPKNQDGMIMKAL